MMPDDSSLRHRLLSLKSGPSLPEAKELETGVPNFSLTDAVKMPKPPGAKRTVSDRRSAAALSLLYLSSSSGAVAAQQEQKDPLFGFDC